MPKPDKKKHTLKSRVTINGKEYRGTHIVEGEIEKERKENLKKKIAFVLGVSEEEVKVETL